METEWKKAYERRAANEGIEDYKAMCWSKDGHDELIAVTKDILSSISNVKTALDVGCGTGDYCNILAEKGIRTTGMDYSPKMLERARKKDKDNNITYIEGDAYNLPFGDKSFDLVISIGVIQCLKDYRKAISELKRVAKKTIILSTLLRTRKVKSIEEHLKRKLAKDSWPTMDYHPEELLPLFKGYKTEVITHHDGNLISDGFFIVAEKK